MPAPHDLADLMLAPVALAIDARLQELGDLGMEELHERTALEANDDARTPERRRRALLHTATYLIDMHGWTADWDPRGLRLTHAGHTIVLGLSPTMAGYLAGGEVPAQAPA